MQKTGHMARNKDAAPQMLVACCHRRLAVSLSLPLHDHTVVGTARLFRACMQQNTLLQRRRTSTKPSRHRHRPPQFLDSTSAAAAAANGSSSCGSGTSMADAEASARPAASSNGRSRSIDDFLARAVEESRQGRRRQRRNNSYECRDDGGDASSPAGYSSNGVRRQHQIEDEDEDDDGYNGYSNDSYKRLCNRRRPWKFWLIFLSLGVANSSDATEILCLSYVLSDPSFRAHILRETAWRGGLLASAVFFGMLVGGLLVGAVGDWQGRRPTLLAGLASNCISGILSSFAADVWTLSALRLAAGVGIGATVPPLFTLCSELAPPADRGFWVSVAASFWMVGSVYVAVVGWGILGYYNNSNGDNEEDEGASNSTAWRVFAFVCAVPSALGFLLIYRWVPESPRFLALQGDYDRAVAAIDMVADSLEFTGPPLTREEVIEHYPPSSTTATPSGIDGRDVLSSETSISSVSLQHRHSHQRVTMALMWYEFRTSASQLYTVRLLETTTSLQTVWFSLSFGSYGLLTWINTLFEKVHLQNVYTNALLFALSNLPGNLLSAFLMDRVGRARLLVGSILAAAASLIVFAYVAAVDDPEKESDELALSRNWIVLAACSFQCFSIAAWNAVDVLTSELFPTTVRATGMGMCAASGRVGAMLAQFVNGSLVARPVRLLLVAAGTLLLGAMTPACLPHDRTGQSVEDRVDVVCSSDHTIHNYNLSSGGFSLRDVEEDNGETDGRKEEGGQRRDRHAGSKHQYTYQPVDRTAGRSLD